MTDPPPDPRDVGPDGDLRALFARTAPAPRPADLAPLRAALRRPRPSPLRRKTPPMKLALSALTALGLAAAAAAFWRADASVAFADVRAAIAAAETVRYTFRTEEVLSRAAEPDPGTGDPTGAVAPTAPAVRTESRVLWSGGRLRADTVLVGDAGGGATIESLQTVFAVDPGRGVLAAVSHADRRAAAMPPGDEWNEVLDGHAALTAWLRDLPPGRAPAADRRRIDGAEAVGFDVPGLPPTPLWAGVAAAPRTARVWVDAATARPVLVEAFIPADGPPRQIWGDGSYRQGVRVFLTDIHLDPDGPAPDSLFRPAVPPGYAIDVTPDW